jgi:hypothetical protein
MQVAKPGRHEGDDRTISFIMEIVQGAGRVGYNIPK